MTRYATLAMLAVLLLCIAPVQSSPVRGQYRERDEDDDRLRVRPGVPLELREVFRGNQRACVIVEGDRNPSMKLTIEVRDLNDRLVVTRTGTDLVAAIWYPPRTQSYRILIGSNGKVFNELEIVMK